MLTFFVLCLCATLLAAYFYSRYKKYEDIRKLPGPPAHPIFGHIFDLKGDIDDIFENLINLNKLYGPVVKIWSNPLKPMVIAAHPKYVEVLFSTNAHLDKSDVYRNFRPFLGNALVITKAETWKKDRKLLNQSFNTKILENFIPLFEYHGQAFIDVLRKHVGKPSVNIVTLVDLFALDLINETIMRTKTDFLHKVDTEYLEARNGFLHIFMSRMYSYLKQRDWLFWLTESYTHQEKCARTLRAYARSILMKRKEERSKKREGEFDVVNGRKQVVIDVLLDSDAYTDEEIIDQVNMFVVAGHDTPASALAFAIFEIAKHSDVQKKILEETISILGTNKDAVITFQDMQQMRYLECVIKEALRMYPTLPFFDRKVQTDIVIDGVRIPEGTDVSICSYRLHNDEKYFPDPQKFDPERFTPENADKIQPFTYIPFSFGPRNCIGKNFTMLQMKSALSKLVRNFELLPVHPEHKIRFTSEFVLKSKNGLPIRLKERKF